MNLRHPVHIYGYPYTHTCTHIYQYIHTCISLAIQTTLPTKDFCIQPFFLRVRHVYTYTPIYTHTYIYTYTYTYAYTCTHIYGYIHTRAHTYINKYIHVYHWQSKHLCPQMNSVCNLFSYESDMYTLTHLYIHTPIYTHVHIHIHTYMDIYIHVHTHIWIYTYTCTRIYRYIHACVSLAIQSSFPINEFCISPFFLRV